ncbi:unnamed protein product, partial [Staurois parvus]
YTVKHDAKHTENHLHGHRLLLQTFVKEWVAIRSSSEFKSICEISLLLNIPRSTVNSIITKWKQLGTRATQP